MSTCIFEFNVVMISPGVGRKLLGVLMTVQEGFKSKQVNMEEVETSFGLLLTEEVIGVDEDIVRPDNIVVLGGFLMLCC